MRQAATTKGYCSICEVTPRKEGKTSQVGEEQAGEEIGGRWCAIRPVIFTCNKKAASGRQIQLPLLLLLKLRLPPCLSHNAIPHRYEGQVILSDSPSPAAA